MDRRLTPSNGRVAHVSLRGKVEAEQFVEGEAYRLSAIVADLCNVPEGRRDRQLLRGEAFVTLETVENWVFGYATKDGYVGWVDAANLDAGDLPAPTHRLSASHSYGKSTPGLKDMGEVTPLPFGALLTVLDQDSGWARVAWAMGRDLFVPSRHLSPRDALEPDPATVAERLVGSPYLWGGNSTFGIDCSGLVQAAFLSCGISCPGDSDLQEAAVPNASGGYERGDLLFWEGHVAMVTDPETLIHANAHYMAVTYENISVAISRITAQGDGPVTSHKRPVRKDKP